MEDTTVIAISLSKTGTLHSSQTSQQTQFLAPKSEAPLALLSLLPDSELNSVIHRSPTDYLWFPPLFSSRNPIPFSSPEHASTPAIQYPSPKPVLRQNQAPRQYSNPHFPLSMGCHSRVESSSVPAQPPSSQQCPSGRRGQTGVYVIPPCTGEIGVQAVPA